MKIIEPATLEKMTAGDAELLADVAVIFVRLLPDLDARLRYGIENRESQEIANAAHQLKSRVSYFGATRIQELASQMELEARKNELTNMPTLHQEIFDGVLQLLDELRDLTKLALEVEVQ